MTHETNYKLQRQILAALKEPMSAKELAIIMDIPVQSLRGILQGLASSGVLINRHTKDGVIYEVAHRVKIEPKFVPTGVFKGVDWSHSTMRPGCMDHLKYHSRRGDVFVEHTGMLISAL